MAEQIPEEEHAKNPNSEETNERGCFDFLQTKKEEKTTHQDVVMSDLNSKEEKHTTTLMDKLQRSHSSSSDEEVDEGGERKKKKKKGLTEGEDGNINPVEKCNEEKKGSLEKIKEKVLHKKGEDDETRPTPAAAADAEAGRDNNKEKKGIMEKIKEKLPGHQNNNQNEVVNNS